MNAHTRAAVQSGADRAAAATIPTSAHADRIDDACGILDGAGRTVLRVGDHGTFFLFALPPSDRAALLDDLARRGFPDTVVEAVDIDVDALQP